MSFSLRESHFISDWNLNRLWEIGLYPIWIPENCLWSELVKCRVLTSDEVNRSLRFSSFSDWCFFFFKYKWNNFAFWFSLYYNPHVRTFLLKTFVTKLHHFISCFKKLTYSRPRRAYLRKNMSRARNACIYETTSPGTSSLGSRGLLFHDEIKENVPITLWKSDVTFERSVLLVPSVARAAERQ